MKNYTTNTNIMNVLSSKLRIDDYQRALDEKRVNNIVKDYKPDLVNYVKCSMRTDGELYIFDGQHTKAALERRNGNKPVIVECRVYEFVELNDMERYEVEAILFAQQNGISKPVKFSSKLRAEYLAGNQKAITFHSLSNTAGLTMNFSHIAADGRIVCVKEAYKAWEALGDGLYAKMLGIIACSWNGQQDGLRREIVGGMSMFLKKYHSTYNNDRLVKCLSKISPVQIIRDGNLQSDSGMGKYAEQIVKIYNKGTKNKLE